MVTFERLNFSADDPVFAMALPRACFAHTLYFHLVHKSTVSYDQRACSVDQHNTFGKLQRDRLAWWQNRI